MIIVQSNIHRFESNALFDDRNLYGNLHNDEQNEYTRTNHDKKSLILILRSTSQL